MKKNILITDGENRSALAATRSIGRAGHNVYISSKIIRPISGASKYCKKNYWISNPEEDIEKYGYDILKLIRKQSIDIVIPMTEPSIISLNKIRNEIGKKCILACPEADKVDLITDKFTLFKHAVKLGVPIPNTVFIQNRAEGLSAANKIKNYPVVIKPGKSKIPSGNGFISTGVNYANSEKEVIDLYSTSAALAYPSMIQEKIVGPGTGCFTLFDKERHLALFSHKRIREKPPSGGVSVVCESVPVDEEMAESAKKLLSLVRWQGVAMVEFKRDLRDGKAKLMEINGRFWGSLQLAIASGVNFPCLLIDYLCGKSSFDRSHLYATGLKLKWFLGTLDHLLIRLKNINPEINLNGARHTKAAALLDFFKIYDRKTTFDVFAFDDVKPFLSELIEYVSYHR